MPTLLTKSAVEESSFVISVTFKDEDENLITPKSATWTLSDEFGNIVNLREDVVISSLATTVNIVLSGDDLAFTATYSDKDRILTVNAVYDSSYGNDLPLKAEAHFKIENLVNIS